MKTWLVVCVAALVGAGIGLGISVYRIASQPWDGTPQGLAGMSREVAPNVVKPGESRVELVGGDTYEFGTMNATDTGHHEFKVRNTGTTDLTLEKGDTTCKCTKFEITKKTLPPGESASVILEWVPKTFFGPFSQSASLMTNDPLRKRIALKIAGKVLPTMRLSTEDLVLGDITAGTARDGTIRLFSFRPEALKIEGHTFSDPGKANLFDVRFEPVPREQLKSELGATYGFDIHVTAKPGLPLGPFQQTITLKTNLATSPTFPVPVKGKIVADLSVVGSGYDPASNALVLGTITTQDEIQRRLTIFARGPHYKDVSFKVLATEPETLQATVGPTTTIPNTSTSQTPLLVAIPRGSPPANHLGSETGKSARIVLSTGHPQAPQLEIRVRYAVRN